ncbi:MAG: tyrosine-type recombinase/integrase [Dehalococcoidales bacterium]|nr:tyrosine-type recombinase/integrase [Dehalococcoidales bacterium]
MQKQPVEYLLLESLVSTTSLESLAKGYILNCKIEGKSSNTIAGYEILLRNFIWYCHQNEFPQIQRLTAVHIRHFFWYLSSETHRWNSTSPAAKRPASPTTVNGYFRALHTFFNWLEQEELIPENPFRNLKTPRPDHKVIRALTTSDLEKLFKLCAGKSALEVRNKAILSVFLDTGLRVSELTNLLIDDVNMDDGSILVRHGKGNKQRLVRIGSKAQKALWKYVTLYRKSTSNRLFINRNGEPLNLIGVQILIKRLGDKANVKVHPHQLRHTFAISFLRAGGDVFSLQYLLGHSTLQMTQRYLQSLNANDAANAHKKFSPLDNLGKETDR